LCASWRPPPEHRFRPPYADQPRNGCSGFSGSNPGRSLTAEILEIGRRCAALPDLVIRPADEILDCDSSAIIAVLLNEANAADIAQVI
jgi:hypothetical protein